MGGAEAIRGYLVQTIICLLDALADEHAWISLTLEPRIQAEKVDILWHRPDGTEAVQIKSSETQIGRDQVERWASELEASFQATTYTLILIGHCAKGVMKQHKWGRVEVPAPRVLPLEDFLSLASQKLATYLERQNMNPGGSETRLVLVKALVTELTTYSTRGKALPRASFTQTINSWLKLINNQQPSPADQSRNILLLKELLSAAPVMKTLRFHNPDFQAWREKVRGSVESIFGPKSTHATRYAQIAWNTSRDETVEQQELFEESCDAAVALLGALIWELERVAPGH